MFRSSLDAIRAKLIATFPDIGVIYVNNIPEGFKRPSFFISLVLGIDDDLTLSSYSKRTIWQIVYFPKEDKAGNPDVFDQLTVSDRIKEVFMEYPAIEAPDGTIYHLIDIEGGPRDEEVYIRITLESQSHRPKPQYDLMQEIHYETKEG